MGWAERHLENGTRNSMYEFRTTTLCSSPVCFLYDIHLDVKDRGLWLCEWIPRPSGFAAPDERSAGFSPGRALARSSCMVSHDDSARGEAELGMAGFSLSGGGVGVGSRSVWVKQPRIHFEIKMNALSLKPTFASARQASGRRQLHVCAAQVRVVRPIASKFSERGMRRRPASLLELTPRAGLHW